MSTHHALHYHIVFSTKNHVGSIQKQWRDRLHAYLGGLVNTLDGVPLAIGGVIDHVHVLVSLGPTHRLCDVVRDVKRQSSAWIHDEIRDLLFTWQDGYGVFSVSPTHLQSVRNYIATQEEHHRSQSFKEEYVEFLKRGGIEYEERYLW